MNSSHKLIASVTGVATFIGLAIMALPLYIVGIALLMYGAVVILFTLSGVLTFLFTPKYWADSLGSGMLFVGIAAVIIISGIGVGITWGGSRTCKAANKIVRQRPITKVRDVRTSAANNLLRASSSSDAAIRDELLRPPIEGEIQEDQLLRGSRG
jgi:hypothetical protein